MKPHIVNFFNALILIILSSWGYFSSETPSVTALIPTIIGVILLLCTAGVKTENKLIAHVAVLLTFIMLLGLIKPLLGALERSDIGAVIRVCVMLLTTIIAMITFIRNFIAVRKQRQLENDNN